MNLKWHCISITIYYFVVTISSYLYDPNDSPDYINSRMVHSKDIRQNFLNKRRHDRVTANRVKLLDRITNDSVFVDGIVHYKINQNHVHFKRVNTMERAFRNLIGMKGVKYIYRRDPYWRTWRRVRYPDGLDRVVRYKCQNSINCTSCQYGGYWVIDENSPPCPYEIVSVIDNEELCAANLTNYTNIEKQCPSVVQFNDILGICDNPIETKWRIQKDYKKDVSELYPAILCNGRDFCEISTFYTITKEHVIFRIINSTNHITYSRVMKNNKNNYACVIDCGIMNPDTRAVSKTDNPLVVDLINNKNKRDDNTKQNTPYQSSTVGEDTIYRPLKNTKFVHAWNEMENVFKFQDVQDDSEPPHHHHDHKKHLSCSSLKHLVNDMSDEE